MLSRFKRDILTKILNVAWGFLLSGTVKVQDLPYASNSTLITEFRDLHCDFTTACRWRSDGGTQNSWGLASGDPDKLVWFAATGTNIVPIEPFAFLSTRGFGGSDILASDDIVCQDGDAIVEFNYWITSDALARVCALNLNRTAEIFCSEPLERRPSPGKAEITVPGPIEQPFKLAVIAGGDGFVVVDDLRYTGKMCNFDADFPEDNTEGATNSLKEREPANAATETQEFLSLTVKKFEGSKLTTVNDVLENVDDLICDFSGEFSCKWKPLNNRVYIIDGKLNGEVWEKLTDTTLEPILPAGFLKYQSDGIASPIIPCQKSDGQIFLRWWVSKNTSVELCAVSSITGDKIVCKKIGQLHEDYPGPSVVDFPNPIQQSFRWHLIPDWSQVTEGFVVLDELSYFADICEPSKAVLKPGYGTVKVITESPPVSRISSVEKNFGSLTATPLTKPKSEYNRSVDLITASSRIKTININTTAYQRTTIPTPTKWPVYRLTTTPKPTKLLPVTEPSWKRRIAPPRFNTPPPLRPKTTNFVPFEPQVRQQSNLCRKLNCDFNSGYCGYRTSPLGTTGWYHRSTPFGRPMSRLTDIKIERETGHYLGALLYPHYVAAVESPKFDVIGGLNMLHFKYFRAAAGAILKICFETNLFQFTTTDQVKRCQTIIPELSVNNARQWNEVQVMLLPGYTKFYIVAEHTGVSSGYAAIGIDDIAVKTC